MSPVKFKSINKLCILMCVTAIFSATSCKSYDEQDLTIIGFLKVNDLLEQQLSPNCEAEIEQFEQTIIASTYGYYNNLYMNYDEDCINYFFNNLYDETNQTYDTTAIENEITSELWTYIDYLYEDNIPAKAQNVEEGRYYTISELKGMYPKYAKMEIEDFSPMGIVNIIKDEHLFGPTSFYESNVNLRTLYIYYLYNRKMLNKIDKMSDLLEYSLIIDSHFPEGMPDDIDVESIVNTFKKLSSGDNPIYTDDMDGFEKFTFDYFETDMFSGEDTEY